MRSSLTRRRRVRRSAGGAGRNPFASIRANVNLSIGFRPQTLSLTAGSAGLRTGSSDQSGRSCLRTGALPGHGAPIATHAFRSATSDAFKGPLGGIFTPSW